MKVHCLRRAKFRSPYTIVYTAASYEKSSRISSSYVCINPGNKLSQFDRILHLYYHLFCDHESKINKLTKYLHQFYSTEMLFSSFLDLRCH